MPLRRRARAAIIGACTLVASLAHECPEARADQASDAKAACASRAEHGQRTKLDGHLRAAREDFLACAQDSCPDAVRKACTDWLSETERSLPTVVVVVRGPNGINAAPAKAWIDDVEIDAGSGRATAIDPGAHVVRARSASGAEATAQVVAVEGRKAEVIALSIAGSDPPPASRGASRGPESEPPRSTFTTGRFVALGIGSAGVLGLGAGGLLALSAQSRYDDSAAFCSGNQCDPPGLAIRQEGIDRANVATIVSIASLVAIATGVVIWLVAGP